MTPEGEAETADDEAGTGGPEQDAESELRERIGSFLTRNFPQIAIHGGSAAIESLDAESGEVWLRLGGACSGCGISPMTIQAIQARMPHDVPGVTRVHVDAGFGATPSFPGRDEGDERFPDAPF